jgi:hypothetical protein
MASLRNNDTLRSLSLRHNKLSTNTATAIADILLYNTALQQLDLAWNAMGQAAGIALAKGIIYNITLVVLCPHYLEAVVLEPCRGCVTTLGGESLQTLDLSWNGLETVGTTAIFKALAENCGLKMLNMSSTRMSNSACPHLAAALRWNTTLEKLLINNNGISPQGEQQLVQALAVNRTLAHLDLKVCLPIPSACTLYRFQIIYASGSRMLIKSCTTHCTQQKSHLQQPSASHETCFQ